MLFLSTARTEMVDSAIELRLDLFEKLHVEDVRNFLRHSNHPIMFTLRNARHGGRFLGSEWERESLIKQLLALKPPYFDLEYDMRPSFLQEVMQSHPQTRVILSYHNFQETPKDLSSIYRSMQNYPAYSYKMAVMTHSTLDALHMLEFVRNHPRTSAICMGAKGSFGRVLGPVFGNLVNYACLHVDEQTAPGQLSAEELSNVYSYSNLNGQTSIYGLIGDPVEKSPGHIYHNAVFRKKELNAVYVKMTVRPEELTDFISLSKALGVRGLSVTIPLKEAILPYIDEIEPAAQKIGAVNTLRFEKGKIRGINTDGLGALDAIEKKGLVNGKRMVLLGAGGAARAIAFEGLKRGADVLVLNRTLDRAIKLSQDLGCRAGGLDEMPSAYDIVVNCSPDPMPIDLKPETVAMDVVYSPRETDFLKRASLLGCRIVYGEEMFLNQAARQTGILDMKKINFTPSVSSPYTDIYFGEGLLDNIASLFKGRVILVADSALQKLYGEDLAKRFNAELITIESGEKAKSFETVLHLIEALMQKGVGRDATLIALGGGVTTDLVSFVASIYMRGIPLILNPHHIAWLCRCSDWRKNRHKQLFWKKPDWHLLFSPSHFYRCEFAQDSS